MPHRRPVLPVIGRLLSSLALCGAAACGSDRRSSAQVDTTTPPRTVEVRARPADSAMRAATAAFDSLDARFAHARAALDSDAITLRDANRLDSAYARRYDAFEAKRRRALVLRDERDRAGYTLRTVRASRMAGGHIPRS
jgi:hypothetical protein